MKNQCHSLALLVLISMPVALSAEQLPVETILDKHIAAMGGAQAIQAIENLRIELNIVEPEFSVRGDYRAASDGRVRIDVFADAARVFSEGIDSEGGWQQNGEGSAVEGMSDAGMAAMAAGVEGNLLGLLQLEQRGYQVRALGRYTHEGVEYHRLQLIRPDGFERHYFINPRTWMIDYTRETSALHPDVNPAEKAVESFYSDYRRVCGVMRSHQTRTIELDSRNEIQRSEITAAQCNLSDEDLGLDRPSSGV